MLLARVVALIAVLALFLPLSVAMGDDGPVPAAETKAQDKQGSAAPTLAVVPAARAAKNPFVITIEGPIDEWTARSVVRRIKDAELSGADAIVIELDTPGGELQSMLVIAGAIKKSRVKTVAWVNPNAYSAGAVIAMACGEIVVSDQAALGDALPIDVMRILQGKGMTDREAEKLIGPVMADLIDSARKNGRDEIMVQGFVRRGVELWLIENRQTGQRYFVTEAQYRAAVGGEPPRAEPKVPSVTGPKNRAGDAKELPGSAGTGGGESVASAPPASEPTRFIPGAPNVSSELAQQVDQELSIRGRVTARPDFASPEHAGKYTLVEYVSDGHGALTFRERELLRYQIAVERVNSDSDLQGFFGASKLTRLDESWAEKFARFLSMMPVKGVLIVIFLIAMFIEMTHPGMVLPGVISVVALAGLVIPPLLVNMSAWWIIAAVVGGVVLIVIELFFFPGTLFAGLAGVILLFAGLIGAVLGGSGFSGVASGPDGLYALATVVLSVVAAIVGMWLVGRHLPSLPFFNRLVLTNDSSDSQLAAPAISDVPPLKVGNVGTAITPLRPAGRAQFGEHIHDVVADVGFIDSGQRVRVLSSGEFRTVVEAAPPDA